ncbi:S8 family peptidase [Bacillus thuringiensis]|uniref:S8 family peptidase n=1 Tax=Bacillus thuringiensis TaxID=1428 RepID=UPI000BF2AE4A|nr:S8 family peptidase [Bacillus thuringiensis]PFE93520.1 serine protease [Bacillus thuringiensis]PGP29846.1 serine protease [Bacillus thuringiensis]
MGQLVIAPTKLERISAKNMETVINQEVPPNVNLIHAPEIWEQGQYGEGIIIAVLDSGCDVNHPQLQGQIIGGKNFTDIGNSDEYLDDQGHGTHVSGIIAAKLDEKEIVGVAPKAKLLILKVLKKDPKDPDKTIGNSDWSVAAIDYAISWRGPNQERVRIINMSIEGREGDNAYHEAMRKAVKNDILVVACAGNFGDIENGGDCSPEHDEYSYPAIYPEVISVGAIALDKTFPCFTNTNSQIDLVAPGKDIHSTMPDNSYGIGTGTSMAAPHVSGALALLINKCEKDFDRSLTENELYAQLIKCTRSLGKSKKLEGNGLIDLIIN